MLAYTGCLQTCSLCEVIKYIPAAPGIGWNLTGGYLFPVVEPNEGLGTVALSAPPMAAALQMHLQATGLPDNYTTHSFSEGGVLSKSLAGTAVDDTKKTGGWKAEQVAWYYSISGATTINSAAVAATGRKRDGSLSAKAKATARRIMIYRFLRPFRKTWRRVRLIGGMLEVQ